MKKINTDDDAFDTEDEDDDFLPEDGYIFNLPVSPALMDLATYSSGTSDSLPHNISLNTLGSSNNSRLLSNVSQSTPTLSRGPASRSRLEYLSKDASDITLAFESSPTILAEEELIQRRNFSKLPFRNLKRETPTLSPSLSSISLNGSPSASTFSLNISIANKEIPLSKEKRKLLSMTRPNWLPPKSAKEEKKHLKEYKKMMDNAMDYEKSRKLKELDLLNQRLTQQKKDLLIWDHEIIPNFYNCMYEFEKLTLNTKIDNKKNKNNNDNVIINNEDEKKKEIRELWWRGVPNKYRSFVWSTTIGNSLKFTEDTFENALKEVNNAKELIKQFYNDGINGSQSQYNTTPSSELDLGLKAKEYKSLFDEIDHDILTIFPDLQIFQTPSYTDIDKTNIIYDINITTNSTLTSTTSAPDSTTNSTPVSTSSCNFNSNSNPSLEMDPNNDTNNINDDIDSYNYHDSLLKIIQAWCFMTPNNYKYYHKSINSIAAILLININDDDYKVFITLSNLLERPLPKALLLLNGDDKFNDFLNDVSSSFQRALLSTCPNLYNHFYNIKLDPLKYLRPLLLPMLTSHLSFKICCRIFDIMVFEGDSFLLRASLGLLMKIQHRLYSNEEDILNIIGWDSIQQMNYNKYRIHMIKKLRNDNAEANISSLENLLKNPDFLDDYRYLDVGHEDDFIEFVRSVLRNTTVKLNGNNNKK